MKSSTGAALDEIELMALPEPAWRIADRVPAGSNVIVYGPRGSFKSVAMAASAGAVVSRRPWYGAPVVRSGPVIVVPAEDPSGWAARWWAWRYGEVIAQMPLPIFTWLGSVNLYRGRGVSALEREVRRRHSVAVYFDTLARTAVGADENSSRDMGLVLHHLDELRGDTDATTVVNHHPTKRGGVERGSSALGDGADTVIAMTASNGVIVMSCEKQRNGPAFAPVRLTFDAAALVLRPAAPASAKLTGKKGDVLRALAHYGPAGATVREWRTCTEAMGVSRRSFFDAKEQLMRRGLVVNGKGERYVVAA